MYDQNPLLHKLTVDDLARPYVSGNAPLTGKRGVSRRDPLSIAVAALTVITLGAYGATAVKAGTSEAPRVNPHPPIVPVGEPADLQLVADYMVCSELAEIRVLHIAEAMACTTLYTEVKLSFLPDIDAADYAAMSVEERVDVNRQGYARYTAWRNAYPERVAQMEAAARARIGEAGM